MDLYLHQPVLYCYQSEDIELLTWRNAINNWIKEAGQKFTGDFSTVNRTQLKIMQDFSRTTNYWKNGRPRFILDYVAGAYVLKLDIMYFKKPDLEDQLSEHLRLQGVIKAPLLRQRRQAREQAYKYMNSRVMVHMGQQCKNAEESILRMLQELNIDRSQIRLVNNILHNEGNAVFALIGDEEQIRQLVENVNGHANDMHGNDAHVNDRATAVFCVNVEECIRYVNVNGINVDQEARNFLYNFFVRNLGADHFLQELINDNQVTVQFNDHFKKMMAIFCDCESYAKNNCCPYRTDVLRDEWLTLGVWHYERGGEFVVEIGPPGGKRELGESTFDCASREAYEEVFCRIGRNNFDNLIENGVKIASVSVGTFSSYENLAARNGPVVVYLYALCMNAEMKTRFRQMRDQIKGTPILNTNAHRVYRSRWQLRCVHYRRFQSCPHGDRCYFQHDNRMPRAQDKYFKNTRGERMLCGRRCKHKYCPYGSKCRCMHQDVERRNCNDYSKYGYCNNGGSCQCWHNHRKAEASDIVEGPDPDKVYYHRGLQIKILSKCLGRKHDEVSPEEARHYFMEGWNDVEIDEKVFQELDKIYIKFNSRDSLDNPWSRESLLRLLQFTWGF